jgi:hypothetical protein
MNRKDREAIALEIGYPLRDFKIEADHPNLQTWSVGNKDWLVCSDATADHLFADQVTDSLWSFRPEFLAGETGLPVEAFKCLATLGDNGNAAVIALVKATCGIEALINSAEQADGRGHMLSGYDGEELEVRVSGRKTWYVYRTN